MFFSANSATSAVKKKKETAENTEDAEKKDHLCFIFLLLLCSQHIFFNFYTRKKFDNR